VRFQYLKENKDRYNIKRACKILNISRSGFYDYLNRKPSNRSIENELLSQNIKRIFEEHKGRYGSKRIAKSLLREGININHKRVGRLMRKMGLYAKGSRYHYKHYNKKANCEEKPNLLNQIFNADGKNQIWLGDITYIHTKKGNLYLAVFMDVYSRRIVGWSMDKRMKEDLVIQAFLQAYGRERPKEGLIVHTDQGSQYTSSNFRAVLKAHGSVHSNSRKGNPYDNAMMESFYRTLKRELVQGANFDTPEQAQKEIFQYIELYYNNKRMHSALGYLSPAQFERQHICFN
jgi:putative transposase